MKAARALLLVMAVGLIAWWVGHTGLQNKSDNEATAALRQVVTDIQGEIPARLDKTMFADVDLYSENDRRIVYAYTYLIRQDRNSTPDDVTRVCAENQEMAATILAAMDRQHIRDPELRVEFHHVGGTLDFSCSYP
ncbi:hypothetical protein [Cellulomonas sp. Y8]|uniref:hypothetical protein n=1 Tax=Cellulomonas sp. Y8 TaxID=2591145 RepID=UPI003D7093CA